MLDTSEESPFKPDRFDLKQDLTGERDLAGDGSHSSVILLLLEWGEEFI